MSGKLVLYKKKKSDLYWTPHIQKNGNGNNERKKNEQNKGLASGNDMRQPWTEASE